MGSLKNYFRGYAAHNKWSNEMIAESLELVSDSDYYRVLVPGIRSMHNLLNHVIIMDELWISELSQNGSREDITSGDQLLYADRASMMAARSVIDESLENCIEALDEEDFNKVVRYEESGLHWPQWVEFAHVFRHQVTHRGQMSVLIAFLDLEVPKLDPMFTPPQIKQIPVMEQLQNI